MLNMLSSRAPSTPTQSTPANPPSPPFPYPREYFFPAFFTLQPNLTTLHAQLTKWSALVLAYARHHRVFRLPLSDAPSAPPFCNDAIDRRLSHNDVREVMLFMRKEGRVEFLGKGSSGSVVIVWWRRVEEWAELIERYVEETGQKGSVLTVYELVDGEAARGQEFHGLPNEVITKALTVIVKRGKAQIFGSEDSPGVKFF